ncbi:DPP IV N-terminal domain-containing protein [candidate division CSSED10-310 bacterium]|uniref:DPP IV N-terminal domain-containing protein n=1 Tax=candidate division CSSED10-310 bacterium TaxID=2855610 RepID=A0ABV6YS69_UNCC1
MCSTQLIDKPQKRIGRFFVIFILFVILILLYFGIGPFLFKDDEEIRDADPQDLSEQSEALAYLTAIENISTLLVTGNQIIAGSSGGLLVFQQQQKRIEKLTFSGGPPLPTISALVQDSKGTIWIGTSAGLARLHKNRVAYVPEVNWPISSLRVHQGELWLLGEELRVSSIPLPGDALLPGDPARHQINEKWFRYIFYTTDEGGLPPDKRRLLGYNGERGAWEVLSDHLPNGSLHNILVNDGKLWAVLYDRFGDRIQSFGLANFDGQLWSTGAELPLNGSLPTEAWTTLFGDGLFLYVGCSRGILRFNNTQHDFFLFPPGFELSDSRVNTLFVREGVIWIGTQNGLGYFDGSEWFFNNYISSLLDNDVFDIISAAPWIMVRTAKGVSLFETEHRTWSWEQTTKSHFGLVADRGEKPNLFKLAAEHSTYRFFRLRPLETMAPHDWPWQELMPPPFHTQEVLGFVGDKRGNLWLNTGSRIWRFNSGRWLCYSFKAKETFTHKFITAQEMRSPFVTNPAPVPNVVEKIYPTAARTWFLIKGRGWKAVLYFHNERWDSLFLKERFAADLALVGADDEGVWIQEQDQIRYHSQNGSMLYWSSSQFRYLKIPTLIHTPQQETFFSLSSIRGTVPYYGLFRSSPELPQPTQLDLPSAGVEIRALCVEHRDLWLGTPRGIIVLKNVVTPPPESSLKDTKQIVAYGDISAASIGKPQNIEGERAPAILPAFSPDGKKLVYVQVTQGQKSIYILDLLTRKTKPLFEDNPFTIAYKPSFSPDGKTILFYAEVKANEELFQYDLTTNKVTQLTRTKGKDWDPVFSPTGEEIIYTSNRWGTNDIYLMARNTRKAKRLTRDPASEWHPTVSPDGENIVYVKSDTKNPGDLWLMTREGQNQQALVTNPGKDWLPSWSPDGKYIAYSSYTGGFNLLYIYDLENRAQLKITHGPYNDLAPNWSFDGHELVFHSDRSGTRELWKIKVR